jgi:hypothetical protein
MPRNPLKCIGKNAMLKPTTLIQKFHLPSLSDNIRFVSLGSQ